MGKPRDAYKNCEGQPVIDESDTHIAFNNVRKGDDGVMRRTGPGSLEIEDKWLTNGDFWIQIAYLGRRSEAGGDRNRRKFELHTSLAH